MTQQRLVSLLAAFTIIALTASDAFAQVVVRGTFTDEWENPIAGALVIIEPVGDQQGIRQETMTEENGSYQFVGLSPGDWELEVHADGYQAIRTAVNVRRTDNRPIEIELTVTPSGGRLRGLEFEAGGGTPKLKLNEDGTFEFEDAEGEGEGTYGIVDLSAILVVRDYDGPDDKFSVRQPVTITAPNDQFLSLTWGEATLRKQ